MYDGGNMSVALDLDKHLAIPRLKKIFTCIEFIREAW